MTTPARIGPAAVTEATQALASRLRVAAGTPWTGDRCDHEAGAYIGELMRRGWTAPRGTADVVPSAHRPANPAVAALRAEEARAAIRAKRGNAPDAPLPATDAAEDPSPRIPDTPNPSAARTAVFDPTQETS